MDVPAYRQKYLTPGSEVRLPSMKAKKLVNEVSCVKQKRHKKATKHDAANKSKRVTLPKNEREDDATRTVSPERATYVSGSYFEPRMAIKNPTILKNSRKRLV